MISAAASGARKWNDGTAETAGSILLCAGRFGVSSRLESSKNSRTACFRSSRVGASPWSAMLRSAATCFAGIRSRSRAASGRGRLDNSSAAFRISVFITSNSCVHAGGAASNHENGSMHNGLSVAPAAKLNKTNCCQQETSSDSSESPIGRPLPFRPLTVVFVDTDSQMSRPATPVRVH